MMQRILHLEGNPSWISLCRDAYEKAGVSFLLLPVSEKLQADCLSYILPRYSPTFLVLTGHDQPNCTDSLHTDAFIRGVLAARRYQPDPTRLFIFAGACKSHAEAIQKAGANFASSPGRIGISILDPVRLILAAASCSPGEFVEPSRIIAATLCGSSGISGSAFQVPQP